MREILLKHSKVDRIGFCYRGKNKDYEYACLILDDGRKIVSTISFTAKDGLTIGEYLQGRIEDYNYCIKTNNLITLKAEFELFDENIHRINKTNISGSNGEFFEKV